MLSVFTKKNYIIYIWDNFNYASLAVSFSCILNKITSEDWEVEVQKYFFRKSFANFTGKEPVFDSLFNKVAGPQAGNFIKKKLQCRCFPVKFEKFSKAPFFTEHLRWLLFKISNSNNLTICLKIFHHYSLRTTNICSPATLTMTI